MKKKEKDEIQINEKGEVKLKEACEKIFGFSAQYYGQITKSLDLPKGKKGLIPLAEVSKKLINHYKNLAKSQGSENLSFQRERLAKVNADTKIFQLKILQFKYIDVDLAEKYWREVIIAIKNNVEGTQSAFAKRLELCENDAASYLPEIKERDMQVLNECSEPDLEQIARDEGDLPNDFVIEDEVITEA